MEYRITQNNKGFYIYTRQEQTFWNSDAWTKISRILRTGSGMPYISDTFEDIDEVHDYLEDRRIEDADVEIEIGLGKL